jgi:MEMO1 family protein
MNRELLYRGSFYPKTKEEIDSFISINSEKSSIIKNLKGVILPHAGWIYSGITALKGLSNIPDKKIERIYLIGPSHRFNFKGVALSRFTTYDTIDSQFYLDKNTEEQLLNIQDVNVVDDAHIHEHSLEVQLEFIKNIYPEVKLIPIIAGRDSIKPLKEILSRTLKEDNSLTILSSDLSHYKPYKEANQSDKKTIKKILNGTEALDYNDACGSTIINALIEINKHKDYKIELLDYRNSGDTAGDKLSVVGYCSMGITKNG